MNEPEVKVLMLKGNDGAKVYYSSVQLSNNAMDLSISDLTPTADSTNPPAVGATVVTPNGDVYSITRVGFTKLGDGDIHVTYDVGNKVTSIKGPQGVSILMYDGDISGSGASGQTATVDLSKIKPNGVAKVGDVVFDHQQNAQGDVELGYWKIDSISGNSANVVGISGGFTIPRGARGEIGPQGERGPQGLAGDISNTKISPSMLTSDLQLSTYPIVDLVDNMTWYSNTYIVKNAAFFNLIKGMQDGKEYKIGLGSDLPTFVENQSFVPITQKTYTFSFEAKSTVSGDIINQYFYDHDASNNCVEKIDGVDGSRDGSKRIQLTENYVRYSTTYTLSPKNIPLYVLLTAIKGTTQGTVFIKNMRLTNGTDVNWSSVNQKIAYLDVKQGETYYARDLENATWLNAPMVVTDEDLNVISSIPAVTDVDHAYKIEIPAGGTKLFLNSNISYHPMLFKQMVFRDIAGLMMGVDTLWKVVMAGKTPKDRATVALEHIDHSQYSSDNAFWDYQRGVLVEQGTFGEGVEKDAYKNVHACKPIPVGPYWSYTVTGYNVYKSNLVTILDAHGNVVRSIPGKDTFEPVTDYVFTIPKTGRYMLVNDNQNAGSKTDLRQITNWN